VWVGMLFALSLPGLVVLLIVLAAVERWSPRRKDMPATTVGFEELDAFFSGGKRLELEDRKSQSLMRDDEESGAPPHLRVDLDGGAVRMVKRY
jgi:hypothetical protein